MTPKIKTYDDLLAEKARLEAVLAEKKQAVRNDVSAIKTQLAPVGNAMSWGSKFFTRDRHNWFVNAGLNTAIDFAFKRVLLSRAGWFTRIFIPFLIKNFTSHIVEEKKMGFIARILEKLLGKKGRKKEPAPEATATATEASHSGKGSPAEDAPEG